MELPITTMIVLFVAVLVGATIIFFAKDELGLAKRTLENLAPEDDNSIGQEGFIEVDSLSEPGLLALIDECQEIGKKDPTAEINCFAVHSTNSISASGLNIESARDFVDVTGYSSGENSVYIKFNPFLSGNYTIEVFS